MRVASARGRVERVCECKREDSARESLGDSERRASESEELGRGREKNRQRNEMIGSSLTLTGRDQIFGFKTQKPIII